MRFPRAICFLFMCFVLTGALCARGNAQAALLMENADGLSRTFDPTGHEAVYFARICAASPTRLRRCRPGEFGVVIARYKGIARYDWLAVPLVPYLYAVEDPAAVPARVNREIVDSLREQYHNAHLMSLGVDVPEGGRLRRGWNQLVGAAYERRIYAFQFETTAAQDDAFIAWMNDRPNLSHFNIVYRNCADFVSDVLDFYFPRAFKRHIAPDGGITTPRQVAFELVRYARAHPEMQLDVLKIPQVPGYRRPSRANASVSESLILTGDVVPLALLNPFLAGAFVADALAWGRFPLPLKQAQVLEPDEITQLAKGARIAGNPRGRGIHAQMASVENQ